MPKGNHNKKDLKDLTPAGVAKNATNILTGHLKRIGLESDTIDDEGNPVTKFETLARMVWDKALGYTEKVVLDSGETVETIHKPDRSFMGMIFDRTEGKVATAAVSDGKKKVSLADRIGEQSKVRLNRIAKQND